MNKLVNLLNQFEKEKTKRSYKIWSVKNWEIDNTAMPKMFNNKFYWVFICSKEYWFIERLVKEDKIDWVFRENINYPYYIEKGWLLHWYDPTDVVIMILSTQEYKIKFLIDLLK